MLDLRLKVEEKSSTEKSKKSKIENPKSEIRKWQLEN